MKPIDKIKPLFTDFLFQTLVFYLAIISPLGVLPYYIEGVDANTHSIVWDTFCDLSRFSSLADLLETIWSFFTWMPLNTLKLSAPLSIANICIFKIRPYKSGDDLLYYLGSKLFFMPIAGLLFVPYVLIAAGGNYHAVLYAAFPAVLTSISYFLFVAYKK